MKQFKIYKSSAGSGKTYTLVKEYLKLALSANEDFHFKRILAITFTNKAANEMKSRVVEALSELTSDEKLKGSIVFLQSDLMQELSMNAEQIKQKSGKVLRVILHNYADFAIGTIDKFTHRIVRTFARDLKLPTNFEVELESDPLLNKAIDLLIAKVGADPLLTELLIEFTKSNIQEEKKWQLEGDILTIAKQLLEEEGEQYLKNLKRFNFEDFQRKIAYYKNENKDFRSKIEEIGQQGLHLIKSNGINNESFARGSSGVPKYFEYLESFKTDSLQPNSFHRASFYEDKWLGTKAKKDAGQAAAIEGIKEQLIELHLKAQQLVDTYYATYIVRDIALKNLYAVALINELDKIIGDIRKTENRVHISEFNKRISAVIASEPAPFIYERIGEKYKHYLIDEFQDTSVMQFHNLIPLFTNALGEGFFNMLVGDAKQSIYRFRGGEVEQFTSLPKIYKAEENPSVASSQGLFNDQIDESFLKKNFRSKMEVVTFNNELFDFCKEVAPEIASLYDNQAQEPNLSNTGGMVEIHFCEKLSNSNNRNDSNEDEEEMESEHFTRTISTIEKCLEDGYQYKDIALLFRNNKLANGVAQKLLELDFPISSAESVLISNSESVNLAVSVLYHITFPKELLYQKEILDALYFNNFFGEKTLHEVYKTHLIHSKETTFWSTLKMSNSTTIEHLKQRPLYEMVEEVFRMVDMFDEADPYIQFFLDEVFQYAQLNNNDVQGFLEWWEMNKSKKAIVIPEGLNAINILTVHKSKGLEFPVVIMPYANESVRVDGGKWIENKSAEEPIYKTEFLALVKELEKTDYASVYEEEKRKSSIDFFNTFYVAVTRPKDRLYIFTNKPPKNSSNHSVPVVLSGFLSQKGIWELNKATYRFGEEVATISEELKENAIELNSFISTDWKSKLQLSLQAPDYWDINMGESARQYGNTIHLILAMIKSTNDVDRILDRLQNQGVISVVQRMDYQLDIDRILSQKNIAKYFAPENRVKVECDLLTADGITFRPDRVVYFDDHVKVIDFKTGQISDQHQLQLKNYMDLIQKVEKVPVRGSLIYIREAYEVEVN
ncbi:UvrD-helicase domain-containing protein [bacterium]|nr:UvrD-helicase domain-containing protein [bacterium]